MDRADLASALSARRLFAPCLPEPEAELELGADAAQHARVLRLVPGDQVALFDGRGGVASARITHLSKGSLRCLGESAVQHAPRASKVVLVQCLPKAGKLDDIVRMTTELGVAEIALATSEHSVARSKGSSEHKLERLERIAVEAARQSEQPYVPTLAAPRPLAEVLARTPPLAYRAACLERSQAPLPTTLAAPELWLVVGPEGGLGRSDRAQLAAERYQPIALGDSILRTETAAVVGVALALERMGRAR